MPGPFPLYTDADVNGAIVSGLRHLGWDVLRAIDAQREGEADDVHFVAAAKAGRVLVSNDEDQILIATSWITEGKDFPGLITWTQSETTRHSVRAFLDAFSALAALDEPFGVSKIIWLKPR